MKTEPIDIDLEEWLNRLDIQSIPDFDDKVRECEFFFGQLAGEVDRSRFRWFLSGFLNAAYSFFESTALVAHFRFTDVDGNPIKDGAALTVLSRHVTVKPRKNKPEWVDTAGLTDITKRLYEIRKKSTHHFPLSIMETAASLPEGFQFGNMRGEGVPVMSFCREVLELIQSIHKEIDW